jgi:glucose-1-phosphate cytidylyltransferase
VPINAGYMVLNKEIFDLLIDDDTVLEREPLEQLVARSELKSYIHHGFWQCMDTSYEKKVLESIWEKGNAPWKKW